MIVIMKNRWYERKLMDSLDVGPIYSARPYSYVKGVTVKQREENLAQKGVLGNPMPSLEDGNALQKIREMANRVRSKNEKRNLAKMAQINMRYLDNTYVVLCGECGKIKISQNSSEAEKYAMVHEQRYNHYTSIMGK